MFSLEMSGSFSKTDSYLRKLLKIDSVIMSALNSAGKEGVGALSSATPIQTGLAAHSWNYEVTRSGDVYTLTWTNGDVENGFPVAIMLQYGYSTGTGGYVQGRDYINPALKPIFDQILNKVWKAVTSA